MQISSFVGKQLLSPSGEKLGCVLQVRLTRDFKKIACLLCADDEAEEFVLPARAILSCGDALIAGNARLSEPTGIPAPIMAPVFTHTGESLGTACDITIEKDAEPMFVVYKSGLRSEYPFSRTHAGDTLVVYPTAAQKPKSVAKRSATRAPKKTKPAAPKPASEPKPMPVPVPAPVPDAEPVPDPIPEPNPIPLPASEPERIIEPIEEPAYEPEIPTPAPLANDYSLNRLNLLGRRVRKSVFDVNGDPVIYAGERITPDVISLARRKNRLLELTVNTLTNVW